MDGAWPWLAVAASGMLHGANPASGWMFAAAFATRGGDRRMGRALLSIALGHGAAVAVVAGAAVAGVLTDVPRLQTTAGVVLVGVAALRLRRSERLLAREGRPPADHAGIAAGCFTASCGSGTGLMLLPALMPVCVGGAAGRITASGSAALVLTAVAVHLLALVATTSLLATGAARALSGMEPSVRSRVTRHGGTAALMATAAALMIQR